MEREGKRKGAPGASPDNEGRATKRQKLPEPTLGAETPETTAEFGQQFLNSITQARDKTGRPIANAFLTLPKAEDVPGYYDQVRLPIALDTIQAKVDKKAYPTLAALESDFKRLVTNAKMFNDKTSAIYLDAERVRKTASNWMVRYNPAYKQAGYSAVATPIPGEETSTPASKIAIPKVSTPIPSGTQKLRLTNGLRPASETPATTRPKRGAVREKEPESALASNSDDVGKSLQDAQIAVIQHMLDYTEDDLQIFAPFEYKPSRTLSDYYSVIKHPVALNGILKKCQGNFHRGKSSSSGVSLFSSWEDFEEEVSYIWRNAQTYNEENSEIYNLATEFETIFKDRLAEAKREVPGPSHPTIKLKVSAPKPAQSLRLSFKAKGSPSVGSPAPGTPVGRSSATPGVIIDSGALARQQQHIESSMNGHHKPSQTRSGSGSVPPINGIKGEVQHTGSPRPLANGVSHIAMPPPPTHATPRPPSVSPLPFQHNIPVQQQYYAAPSPASENPRRKPNQEVILPNIQLSTNPALRSTPQWKLNIQSHPTLTHQSVTCTLPAAQHILQVIPTIPVANTSRPYRVFVNINGTKLTQAIRPGPGEHEREKDHPPYDVKLGPGVNRIEVELLAGSDPTGGKKEEVLREKCTIFVNLLRQ